MQYPVEQRQKKYRGNGGQALIEMAVTLPFLLLLLIGAFELARAGYAAIEVSNAANAGAQFGALNNSNSVDTTGIQTAASGDAPNIALGTTSSSISCICSDGSASTCLSTDCSSSHIEHILTVQTHANFDPLIHWPGVPNSFPLTGRAVRKVLP
jgi:Flp pilus assembly protein TadG